MPEGDSVARLAARLRPVLAGGVLTAAQLRVGRYATTDLVGSSVTQVRSYGKHLLMSLQTPAGGELTLDTHLRMDGYWRVLPEAGSLPRPAHQVRVVLDVDHPTAGAHRVVGMALGEVHLLQSEGLRRLWQRLGPDLLGEQCDLPAAAQRVLASGHASLGEALLDQRVVAGIGTEYRAEQLFLAGIDPRMTLTQAAAHPGLVEELLRRTRKSMQANVARRTRTHTGDLRTGLTSWVFGRGGKPCRRCRTTIRQWAYGSVAGEERFVWVCPRCQPPQQGPYP